MQVSSRSILMAGMAAATAGVIAVTPSVVPLPLEAARHSAEGFTSLPIRDTDVELTGVVVDLITNATVAVIDLYYPIRNAGQVAIDVANAIVYNPFIQVWPITAWMSQINAAWTLGTGILDPTPPGAGVVDLLTDAVQIPQNVLNGTASLGDELSEVVDLSVNALNYSAAYLLNYGFYQLAYFTWIWISPIDPPLFPLLPATAELKLPGFLTGESPLNFDPLTAEADSLAAPQDFSASGIPAGTKAALAPKPRHLLTNGIKALTAAAETFTETVTGLGETKTDTDSDVESDPAPLKDQSDDVDTPRRPAKGLVAAQGEVRGAIRNALRPAGASQPGDRSTVRKSLVATPSTIAKHLAAGAEKVRDGLADAGKDVSDAVGGKHRKPDGGDSPAAD